MARKNREPKAERLNSISLKYVEDEELRDAPARLYRKILKEMEMNPRKWSNYLRDYLEWVVTIEDREKAKADRITKAGNIKETYFQKHTLTFNKLLEGLSILRMDECDIILRVKDAEGHVYEVSEHIRIMGKDRPVFKDNSKEPKT